MEYFPPIMILIVKNGKIGPVFSMYDRIAHIAWKKPEFLSKLNCLFTKA